MTERDWGHSSPGEIVQATQAERVDLNRPGFVGAKRSILSFSPTANSSHLTLNTLPPSNLASLTPAKPKRARPSSSLTPPASKRLPSPTLNPTQQLASLHITDQRSLGEMASPQTAAKFEQLAKEWNKGDNADKATVESLLSQLKVRTAPCPSPKYKKTDCLLSQVDLSELGLLFPLLSGNTDVSALTSARTRPSLLPHSLEAEHRLWLMHHST